MRILLTNDDGYKAKGIQVLAEIMKELKLSEEEIDVLMEYLPEQLDSEAVNKIIDEIFDEVKPEGQKDMGKIMEVARRIMKGDIVPPSDERKLMEFDDELYQAAKNIGRMRQRLEEQKEHESLWEDEEPKEYPDPMEVADHSEAFGSGPEIVSVEETMASVEMPTE